MPAERVIDTDRKTQVVDVTALCQSLITEAKNGIAVFNVLNRTAALIKCEDEPNLRDDLAPRSGALAGRPSSFPAWPLWRA